MKPAVFVSGLLLLGSFASGVRAATPNAALRAIAAAEDARQWSDGVLRGYLKDGASVVRARAALAVGRLQDSTSVPALLELTADLDTKVRREAVFALGQVGHRSARTRLEGALGDRDPQVVELAVEALGKLGDKAATPRVMHLLDSRVPLQRSRAAEALWRLADSAAVPALIAHLGEPDPAVRWRVVYALEKVLMPAQIVPAVTPVLADRDPLVRAHAARTLGRERSPLAVDALVRALTDTEPAVVVNALRSLQQIGDSTRTTQLPALTRALRAHRDPHVRVTAATVLAEPFAWVGADAATAQIGRSTLHDGVADRDPATRGACGRAILMREGMKALAGVQPLFRDSVVYARTAVLEGLRALPDEDYRSTPPRVVNALQQSMGADRPLLERMTAADLAGSLMSRLKLRTFDALLPRLREGVGDADMLVSASCAAALAEAGDVESVPLLASTYASRGKDAEPDARIAIRDAMRALAGQPFADSVEHANPTPAAAAPPDADFASPPRETRAVITTSEGVMEWAFHGAEAPQTVKNFVRLARKGYFDSLSVHRVVPDFVIQDGDPTGTGSGGPGYTIRCEYNMLRYETGMVGMALSGKDTGGSQWFVTLSPQPHLNGRYTIFAHVTKGMDVAQRISQGARIFKVEVRP